MSFESRVKFSSFVVLTEGLSKHQKHSGTKSERNFLLQQVSNFFDLYRDRGGNFYPLLRLLIPSLDTKRCTYGIKANSLVSIYSALFNIPKDSPRAKLWKDCANEMEKVSFVDAIYFELLDRSEFKDSLLSIVNVNEKLDELYKIYLHSENKSNDRLEVFRYMFLHSTALEQKWFIKIILDGIFRLLLIL